MIGRTIPSIEQVIMASHLSRLGGEQGAGSDQRQGCAVRSGGTGPHAARMPSVMVPGGYSMARAGCQSCYLLTAG